MINNKTVVSVILAAGSGTRFGGDKNKVYIEIHGKPIVCYSLQAFDKNESIDRIIVVVRKGEEETMQSILEKENLTKPVTLCFGGNTRQESVYNAINTSTEDIAIIHDSARPAIKQEYIDKCLKEMNDYKGVSMGVKSKDTIKITDENRNNKIDNSKKKHLDSSNASMFL